MIRRNFTYKSTEYSVNNFLYWICIFVEIKKFNPIFIWHVIALWISQFRNFIVFLLLYLPFCISLFPFLNTRWCNWYELLRYIFVHVSGDQSSKLWWFFFFLFWLIINNDKIFTSNHGNYILFITVLCTVYEKKINTFIIINKFY